LDLCGIDFSGVILTEAQQKVIQENTGRIWANANDLAIAPGEGDDDRPTLTRSQLDTMIRQGESLQGRRLKPQESVEGLSLDGIVLDKTMAQSLIDAGMDAKGVLIAYFKTPPTLASHFYKAQMLQDYLNHERHRGSSDIDISEFDLSDTTFNDTRDYDKLHKRFRAIDFSKTRLSQKNVEAIIKGGGNLRGARLANDVQTVPLGAMDTVKLDKTMAHQLIQVGANPRAVLLRYLASERELNRALIDLSGLDLKRVDPSGIDLRGVNTSRIVFAKTSSTATVSSTKLRTNFEKDMLELMRTYSETVHFMTKQSSSWDIENIDRDTAHRIVRLQSKLEKQNDVMAYERYLEKSNDSEDLKTIMSNFFRHWPLINQLREQGSEAANIEGAIKMSIGNCYDMALICKGMLDLYLQESLALLGYHDVRFKTTFMSAKKPDDHGVIKLSCLFQGVKVKYLIDPLSDGQAWKYEDGVNFFRNKKPDAFTHAKIEFHRSSWNKYLNDAPHLEAIQRHFTQFGVKEQLILNLRANQSRFVGARGI
jgi:uncharacterized protein YjbI with pentapeptide repeats